MDIQAYLATQKEKIDRALTTTFQTCADIPPVLREAMEYSLKAGGKRVRPVLVLASAAVYKAPEEKIMPVALAMELIHTFSLIHDDLPAMDNDDLRRGQPTSHKVFGEGKAILAGDGMLSHAFFLLARLGKKGGVYPTLLLEVIEDIAKATGAEGMVGGQVLDLQGEGADLNEEGLRKIHRYKTGALITASVISGAKLAGAGKKDLEHLKVYGDKIGLAFQIADDVLNVEGTTKELGKKAGSDASLQKTTYPSVCGLEESKKKARQLVEEAVKSLETFDSKAGSLREIARYIIQRKS
ncbi:MAG: polyprenyl synthetase family protein [Deltaproteobacteria bacterium]|nr:polyprenyl synthetase family protein [Deltaproteobacteria bacterium]